MALPELPSDVLINVLGKVSQADLSSLLQTCRALHSICIFKLYQNLYITSSERNKDTCGNYSIVQNKMSHQKGKNPFKLLEASLRANPSLVCLINNIVVDDIMFILFKLKSWTRLYFTPNLHELNIKSVYFGDVPFNHFNTAYDDLHHFYVNIGSVKGCSMVQIRNFEELVGLADKKTVRPYITQDIMLNLTDENDHIVAKIQNDFLLQTLANITTLTVVSSKNSSMAFFQSLADAYGEAPLFKNLKKLTFNHFHDVGGLQGIGETYNFRLTPTKMAKLFGMSTLEELNLQIGCYACADSEDDSCDCLDEFLENIRTTKASKLRITRLGPTLPSNTVVSFKKSLTRFFETSYRFKDVVLDTNCVLFPFHKFSSEAVEILVGDMNLVNTPLLRSLKRFKRVSLPDYIESYHVWEHPDIGELLKSNGAIEGEIKRFLQTNKDIQFYLNPITFKSDQEYQYDLVNCILEKTKTWHKHHKLKVPKGFSSMSDVSNQPVSSAKINVSSNFDMIPQHVNAVGLVVPTTSGLHDVFRHGTYKELVNYNFVNDILKRQWVIEGQGRSTRITTTPTNNENDKCRRVDIECLCLGDELNKFATVIWENVVSQCNSEIKEAEIFSSA